MTGATAYKQYLPSRRYAAAHPGSDKNRKVTQAELADKIGISESALSRYLQGKTEMLGDGYIIRITKLFEVSTDFLHSGTGRF